ncbi:hypothetical protein L916_21576, partial [Phytophthora nicotianae]
SGVKTGRQPRSGPDQWLGQARENKQQRSQREQKV